MEHHNALTPLNSHKMADDKKEVTEKVAKKKEYKVKKEFKLDKLYKPGNIVLLEEGKIKETLISNKFI